jgi:Protein of unknown function (DUF1360)
MSLAAVVIVGLAVFRVARLITADSITDPMRDRLYVWAWRDDGHGHQTPTAVWRTYVYELIRCPHCVGVWAAAGAYLWWEFLWTPPIYVAAIAGVASLLASAQTKLDAD